MPHSGGSGAWGSGGWGYGAWGGGSGGVLTLLSVVPIRENAFRLEFSAAVHFTTLLDEEDAANPASYSVAAVSGTTGLDGNPVRGVSVVEVFLPGEDDGVAAVDRGRFVDLVLDRPMTPWPAQYDVTATGVHAFDLLAMVTATMRSSATFKQLAIPRLDTATPSRDVANPQTLSASRDSLPDPTEAGVLGTFRVDDTGDYAVDEGLVSLRKRVIRRLVTSPGAFAHLPGYGVGIPDHGKRLAIGAVISALAAAAQGQIALEPDVAAVRVRALVDPSVPGLVRFQVFVRPREGQPQRIDVPFITG